jgi:hypothetical protein
MVVEKWVSPLCLALTCRRGSIVRYSPDKVARDYGIFTAGSPLSPPSPVIFDYMVSKRAKDSPSNG